MAFERLDFTGNSDDEKWLDISNDEIFHIYKKIAAAHFGMRLRLGLDIGWFKSKGITEVADIDKKFTPQTLVPRLSMGELQFIFLCKHIKKIVSRDLVSAFVRKYKPHAASDQQPRHLGSKFWYVLNKDADIPDTDKKVPSGYHCCISIDTPHPNFYFYQMKRSGRINARTFEELKAVYKNRCATCGRKEGTRDERNGDIPIELQQGHMDPRKELALDNVIPQCPYCNQTYKDYFFFNEDGRIIAINNPTFLLQSPKDVQLEALTLLRKELQED